MADDPTPTPATPAEERLAALLRELQAPASPQELAAREAYLTMYRREQAALQVGTPAPRRRRHGVRRVLTGGGLAAVLAVTGGGVAAAYAGSLPAPLQRLGHQVLGPVGVPAAAPEAPARPTRSPRPTRPADETLTSSATATTGPRPTSRPGVERTARATATATTRPGRGPASTLTADPSGTVGPSASVLPTDPLTSGAPTTSADPTATASSDPAQEPALRPRTVTVSAVSTRIDVGETAVLTGTVTAGDGSPVARVTVSLEERVGGRWRRIPAGPSAVTDREGEASLVTPVLDATTTYGLAVGPRHSEGVQLVALPRLGAVVERLGARAAITASVVGGRRGDAVRLLTRRGARTVVAARGRLAGDGTVTFVVRPGERVQGYGVVLARTSRHAAARVDVEVPARASEDPGGTGSGADGSGSDGGGSDGVGSGGETDPTPSTDG